jgi:uncharacterized FAD-dependent dehydrogenase
MTTLVRDLPLPLGHGPADLHAAVAAELGVGPDTIVEARVRKVSLDARGKNPKRVMTVEVWTTADAPPPDESPKLRVGTPLAPPRAGAMPIIVGTGPAGLWAALRLLEAGHPSILLDRGGALVARHRDVVALRSHGQLNPESNLCFGAGGAGTYSDGKLYTRRRDPEIDRIHADLVALGAPASIMSDAHPHVGTNRIIMAYKRLEAFLVEHGCEVRYGAKVVDLLQADSGRVHGVVLASGETVEGPGVILATGHSARDVYRWLHARGVQMERKPFAIGARCEHPQALIDRIQYGPHAEHPDLEPAEYFLKAQVADRGVYSFCMCPGGFVIPTPTEPNCLNVNGMSNHKRGTRFANAALVATVEPRDFWIARPGDLDHHGPLAGLAFQSHLEATAFEAGGGGYRAPAQRLTDFLTRRQGTLPAETSFRPGLTPADLHTVIPARFSDAIARAVLRFDQKMRGYHTAEAVLVGVETTTSSPVRLVRDELHQAPGFPGLYPAGEGAGQAGGIVSSALDGLRVAESMLAMLPAPGASLAVP